MNLVRNEGPAMSCEPPQKKQRQDDGAKGTSAGRTLAVLGLGNPGRTYERHSLGARVAAAVAEASAVAVESTNKDMLRFECSKGNARATNVITWPLVTTFDDPCRVLCATTMNPKQKQTANLLLLKLS